MSKYAIESICHVEGRGQVRAQDIEADLKLSWKMAELYKKALKG